jgi:hypothetical protein
MASKGVLTFPANVPPHISYGQNVLALVSYYRTVHYLSYGLWQEHCGS